MRNRKMTEDFYGILKVKHNAGGLLNGTNPMWRPKGMSWVFAEIYSITN